MSNFIEFPTKSHFKFVAEPISIPWVKSKEKQLMAICVIDVETECKVIHPISELVLSRWSSNPFNTIRKPTILIVAFLNYLLAEHNIDSLNELNLSHGNRFLNSMGNNGRSYGTIKDAERILTHFYKFLFDKNVLKHLSPHTFTKIDGPYGSYTKSPFSPQLPEITAKDLQHLIPYQYIPRFLEYSVLEAYPIVLGVYFQIFGGLRMSEVVNLSHSDLRRLHTGDLILRLNNRNLRKDIKTGNAGVKRPRQQRIFSIHNWLDLFYENHIERFQSNDGSNAVFVNRDGKAMSGGSYKQHFDSIKTKFIQGLTSSDSIDDRILGEHLRNTKWSTHIGRGTFTNLLAEEAENPAEIAFNRGDLSLDASLAYMAHTERLRKKIEEKLQSTYDRFLPLLIERRR